MQRIVNLLTVSVRDAALKGWLWQHQVSDRGHLHAGHIGGSPRSGQCSRMCKAAQGPHGLSCTGLDMETTYAS
jgi:hypothetical protein